MPTPAPTPNTATWPYLSGLAPAIIGKCEGQSEQCALVPFDKGCPDGKTPHHLVPSHCFVKEGLRKINERAVGGTYGAAKLVLIPASAHFPSGTTLAKGDTVTQEIVESTTVPGAEKYRAKKAPCICVEGSSWNSVDGSGAPLEHNMVHQSMDLSEATACVKAGGSVGDERTWKYSEARDAGVQSASVLDSKCDPACLAAQLDNYHQQQCGMTEDTPLRASAETHALEDRAKAALEAQKSKAASGLND